MSLIQSGWCQQSLPLATHKPKHTRTHMSVHAHTHQVVQRINRITSRAPNKLLILRWLTFCVFEALPMEDFFTCWDLSLSLRVKLCPTLYLLPRWGSLPPRLLKSVVFFSFFVIQSWKKQHKQFVMLQKGSIITTCIYTLCVHIFTYAEIREMTCSLQMACVVYQFRAPSFSYANASWWI